MSVLRPIRLAPVAILTALSAAIFVSAQTAKASERQLSEEQRAQIVDRVDELNKRLNLSEDQREALEPIFAESIEDRMIVLDAYGVSPGKKPNLRFRQMRALRGELNNLRNDLTENVSEILSDDQLTEFIDMQDEFRDRMRAQFKSGRK